MERHTGEVGLFSQTIPWEALCRHSLAAYFLQTLGAEGHDRPLLVSKRRAFGCSAVVQHKGRYPRCAVLPYFDADTIVEELHLFSVLLVRRGVVL